MSCLFAIIEKKAAKRRLEGEWYDRIKEKGSTKEQVWEVVTDLSDCSWRSDLQRIDVLEPGKTFVEYTKEGFPTTFVITRFEPPYRYEFTMDNANMTGTWTGLFRRTDEGCEAEFTERVDVKKWIMKPFVPGYLRKQQEQYFNDLKAALGE